MRYGTFKYGTRAYGYAGNPTEFSPASRSTTNYTLDSKPSTGYTPDSRQATDYKHTLYGLTAFFGYWFLLA